MEMDAEQLKTTTTGFAELMLGMSLYQWQANSVLPLEWATGANGKRQNIAVCTPNGSGKDERIIPTAAYWWLFMHPRGRVVITSKSDLQLSTQTIPNLNKHWRKFGWPEPINSPRYTLITPTGGNLIAYVTNEGARAEGHHSRPGEPLLMINNEAKSIDSSIWEGIDRCTPDCLMNISSPGLREGRFYECFQKLAPLYHLVKAGLADCPHITQEKIDSVIAIYGKDHPITRSTLYGEFMSQIDGEQYCVTVEELENCLNNPPPHKPGFKFGFFDFADGRAENVLVLRDGNKYSIADAWRDVNEDAVVGRAIYLIRKHNLSNTQWGGDAAAKSIMDKLAQAGHAGKRQNFGAPDKNGIYKSWSAMAWLEGAQKIRNRELILPDDPVLRSQLTTRKRVFTPSGKLAVEDKFVMLRQRGVESPDRADAFLGCAAEQDTTMEVPKNIIDLSQWNVNERTENDIGRIVGI